MWPASIAVPGRAYGRSAVMGWPVAVLAFVLAVGFYPPLGAQDAPPRAEVSASQTSQDFGRLFDAVVDTTAKQFWDKERLARIDWQKRAARARQGVVDAPNLDVAAQRINALLGELETSHTALLTPDDVNYYILMAVFSGASMPQQEFDERFWGAGVTFAGIGMFSVRIGELNFVDQVLEGSPAARAGLKAGDEIVSVDGSPFHPIRSFRGKIGHHAAIAVRRTQEGPVETIRVPVMSIAPLHAFREATRASARVIEKDGQRIGYVHVWASVGEESSNALHDALSSLGINEWAGGTERKNRRDASPRLDGLIIDMRGRIGGTATNAGRYLDLLDPRGPLVQPRDKSQLSRSATAVRGRTAVLIDHHTRSTAELFVHAYKRERQGPLIGTRTAGAVSAARGFAMPGGSLLYVAVSGLKIDGEVLEGTGVEPDVEVDRPVPYARGRDPVLDAAVRVFAGRAKTRGSGETNRESADSP